MKKALQDKKINKRACPQCFRHSGYRRGFSLVEVIISVFLITVGLIASVELIGKGLQESMDSRDQSIATELAQEGIELVRNVRDNNWLQTIVSPDDSSFEYLDEQDSNIDKDFKYGEVLTSIGPLEYRLTINNDGFYVSDPSGTPTKFYRQVSIRGLDGSDTREIISMVVWDKDGTFPAVQNCNTSARCAFTQTTLSRWGEGSFNQ